MKEQSNCSLMQISCLLPTTLMSRARGVRVLSGADLIRPRLSRDSPALMLGASMARAASAGGGRSPGATTSPKASFSRARTTISARFVSSVKLPASIFLGFASVIVLYSIPYF